MNKGFYKNISTMSPFQFDKIYPNKKTMDENATTDGILIGRYVFIEYNDENEEQYANNSAADGGKNYDSTIWQKIYDKENNIEKYIQIASVDTPLPGINTTPVLPETEPSVSIDYTTSPETYNFQLPKSWGFQVKKAETEYSDEVDESGNKLNIYYNKNAFDNISFKEIGSFEIYAPNEYYYISDEEEMQKNNAITQNDMAYIIGQPVEPPNNIEPDKIFNNNEYYKVKFLKDNQYLWTNVKDSEEQLYTYGETGHFIFSLEDFEQIDENKFKDYSFIKIQNNIYEACDYADKDAVQADWEAGATIFYLTYEEADKSQQNNNTKYYKLDNNSEYYEISIVEQSPAAPYWEKFSSNSSYYSLVEGEHLKKDENASPKENTQYYKQDDNGSLEFEFEGEIKKYSPVTFGVWEPYKYYKKYGKMGDINDDGIVDDADIELAERIAGKLVTPTKEQIAVGDIDGDGKITIIDANLIRKYHQGIISSLSYKFEDFPYEEFNGCTYVLSFDKEKKEGPYYEKIPYLKNEEINNKISLESDINNEVKELSLILPGLGNTVAEVYDLLYKDRENRNSILYSSIEENQNMYDNDGNPLYNDNEKSVVGLMNKIYDLIGHMKVIDFPALNEGENLSNGTIIIPGTDNDGSITLENYNDLSKTLFKKTDGKYYLIIKYKDNEGNDVYEEKEFNEKSLYYLIAEMEHLVSGSYEGLLKVLDNELKINIPNTDIWLNVEKLDENRYSYAIKHNTYITSNETPANAYQTFYNPNIFVESNNKDVFISFTEGYKIDRAGHVIIGENIENPETANLYLPSAYVGSSISDKAPIGSIWYDISS